MERVESGEWQRDGRSNITNGSREKAGHTVLWMGGVGGGRRMSCIGALNVALPFTCC